MIAETLCIEGIKMYYNIVVTPAYGRDYKSKKAVIEDWDKDLDFTVEPSGRYVNKQQTDQLLKTGITHIEFRYAHKTKLIILNLTTGKFS